MESKTSIIVIGLNPGKRRARKGSTIPRLNSWMEQLGIDFYSFSNLSNDPEWDFKFKSIDKNFVVQILQNYDIIVALGNVVENHLKKLGYSNVYKLPHPSPLNRLLNDKSYEKKVIDNCRKFLNENSVCIRQRH